MDSENPVITQQGVDFDEINVCMTGKDLALSVVRAQEEPEWQGYRSLGQRQGDYVPVNCIQAEVTGSSERIVTVLTPHETVRGQIVSVEAGTDVIDDRIIVHLEDGRELVFHENNMKKGRE